MTREEYQALQDRKADLIIERDDLDSEIAQIETELESAEIECQTAAEIEAEIADNQ